MSLDLWLGAGIPEDVVEKAIEWVARLDGTELPQSERADFLTWLDEAPEHQWAYEEISEAWSKLHGLREVADVLHRSQVVQFLTRTESTPPDQAASTAGIVPSQTMSTAIAISSQATSTYSTGSNQTKSVAGTISSQTASATMCSGSDASRFDLFSVLSWSALALVAAGLFAGIAH
jgi:ferric-dicitrate binding protein FerR (iron transport regulator)